MNIITITKKRSGFTLVEVMIVVLILGVLMAIAVPNYTRARESSRKNICIENLRQIDASKEAWAMEFGKNTGTAVAWTDLVGPTGFLKQQPICPAAGTYTVGAIGNAPTCSISGHSIL